MTEVYAKERAARRFELASGSGVASRVDHEIGQAVVALGHIQALPNLTTREVSLTGIPHMGRATLIGALIGALSIAVPVSAVLLYLSADAISILAGLHVGFFGGMGFGGMLGAVIQADRHETSEGADHDRNIAGGFESARRAA